MTTGLDPGRTFATFVGGGANQLALSAARAMAESPSPPFNPLYIAGGPGLGKTHLLQAIGHRRLEVDPQATVRCVTWGEVLEGWRAAHALGRGGEFLQPLARAGLLLVDDAHGLGEAGAGRSELLGVLEARLTARLPTVLAGRRAPAALVGPDDHASRALGGGLVVELGRPDAAMRWEILQRRSVDAGAELAPGVLQAVAALPLDTIRDVVGAAQRLVAFQSVSDIPLDPEQARVLITGELDQPVPDAGIPVAAPAAVSPRPPIRPAPEDEFGSFLSEVVSTVSEQVDQWRSRVAERILHHEAMGVHTARLHALLDQELPAQPDAVLQRFERDLEHLRRLEAEVEELAPDLAAHEAFRDPDQIAMAEQLAEQARTRDLAERHPLDHLRLADLVEGACNREAIEAVRAMGVDPGGAASPLVLTGASGTGKSHLLHALGNLLLDAGLRGVACLDARAFAEEAQLAHDADRVADWRRRYRWASALLVDDVHLLAGETGSQEELAGLLDRLAAAGRPVAVTSAVPVAELAGCSPRLLNRLAAGLECELARPDREVRLGVLRQLLTAHGAGDDAALVDYLASRPADSVRALQGLVQRVVRAAEAAHVAPSHALARQVLEATTGGRGRGVASRPGQLGPTLGGPRLREKLVQEWPRITDRLIEDLR